MQEVHEDSHPLLPQNDNSPKVVSPGQFKDNVATRRNSIDSTKNPKVSQTKEIQIVSSLKSDRRPRHHTKRLIRRATTWKKKSKDTQQMKNEARERKATETLAIVLGN